MSRNERAISRRKAKHWCFTLNNPTREDDSKLQSVGEEFDDGPLTFIVIGLEEGEEEKTPHWQGYVCFKNRVRLSQCKTILFERAHYEICRGSPRENYDYCTKAGDPYFVRGEVPVGRGRRTDLEEIREALSSGVSERDIANDYFSQWCQYRRSFSAFTGLLNPPLARPELRVFLLLGPTGTGKTRFATDWATRSGGFWMSTDPGLQWFDGYNNEPVAIIDDYNGECGFRFLLRVLDVYALRVPVKGGFVAWNPSTIFITANTNPEAWYPTEDISPLRRRITRICVVNPADEASTWEQHSAFIARGCGLVLE